MPENKFKKAADARKEEQKEIKAKLSEKADDEVVTRTTICISLSAEEKYQLKLISAKRNKTVSRLIQDWIAENREE